MKPLKNNHLSDSDQSINLFKIHRQENPFLRKLDMSLILNMLSGNLEQSQRRYKRFVIEKSYKNIALGSEKFIEKIKNKIDSKSGDQSYQYGLCCYFSKRFENEMKKNRIL